MTGRSRKLSLGANLYLPSRYVISLLWVLEQFAHPNAHWVPCWEFFLKSKELSRYDIRYFENETLEFFTTHITVCTSNSNHMSHVQGTLWEFFQKVPSCQRVIFMVSNFDL